MLSAYKNTAYVLLGGALCKAWQLIFSCFSLCALVKRCFWYAIKLRNIFIKCFIDFSFEFFFAFVYSQKNTSINFGLSIEQ